MISDAVINLGTAILTGTLFTAIPIYFANRRNNRIENQKDQSKRQELETLKDQDEFDNLLEKSRSVDERLDKYIQRIEQENTRLRAENHALDVKLDEMHELLIDCKDKLRIAQSLLEQFQQKKER